MFKVPIIIRGTVIEGADLEFGGRRGDTRFSTPDVSLHVDRLALKTPSSMSDMYRLSIDEILDYLESLGEALRLSRNAHMQEAFELSCATSGLGREMLRMFYEEIGWMFRRSMVLETFQRAVGLEYLKDWVPTRTETGIAHVRAFGARTVHVVAGNSPGVSAMTIVRNAMTRSDAIIKTPSNDPLTAAAIARTMIDMAPDHPLTRHLSVAYWKGGDEKVEAPLYQPANIEKIVAWGGMSSIKHITRYIQPGVELIALDPKHSSTLIGRAAFDDQVSMRHVARALAADVGHLNQEGCVNARVVYVESGTDRTGIQRINQLGDLVWQEILALPPQVSTPAVRLDEALQDELEGLQVGGSDWYRVIGGGRDGAVIVSQMDELVDFAAMLSNRVVNLVPVDDLDRAIRAVTSDTQTIGIYPESLKNELRDALSLQGAQRLVTLGHAVDMMNHGLQDGIEPLRRMCRWIVDEAFPA